MPENLSIDGVKKPPSNAQNKRRRRGGLRWFTQTKAGRRTLGALIAVLLLGSIASTVYFYKQYSEVASDPSSAQTEKNQAETVRVLEKVKAAILVTETDEPKVARIEDTQKLQAANPEFYKHAQKGDYLIVFPKRAIIYRESNNQIINVAAVATDSGGAVGSATQQGR